MKRLINIFSIILLLSFSITTITTAQVTSPKSLGQGIYSVRDANLLVGTRINVHITPANAKAIILVIDSDHTIEALVRLNTKITEQTLPPLNYDSSLIIFTNGSVVLS